MPEGKKDSQVELIKNFLAFCTFIKRIGIPTAIIAFFWMYSTPAQKVKFIDIYILGFPALFEKYSSFILAIVIGIVVGQRTYFQKKGQIQEKEIQRLSQKKSEYQQQGLGTDLDHVDDGGTA